MSRQSKCKCKATFLAVITVAFALSLWKMWWFSKSIPLWVNSGHVVAVAKREFSETYIRFQWVLGRFSLAKPKNSTLYFQMKNKLYLPPTEYTFIGTS